MKKNKYGSFRLHSRFLMFKLVIFFLIVGQVSIYARTSAQNQTINLVRNNVLLSHILAEIEQLTDYTFVYNSEDVAQVYASIRAHRQSVREALASCLKGTGLAYVIEDKLVILRKEPIAEVPQTTKPITVEGIVTDNSGPLPGVTIVIKGTGLGVTSDVKGKFRLELPDTRMTLIFSFIGMKTKEVVYKGEKVLQVTMEPNAMEIEEVVVTGYQVIDKKKLTSAVTSVKAEDIMVPGTMSIDQMLQGQVPDLIFQTNSGEVGVVPKIRIRGTSTLIGNREPLWVVDGIIVQDLVPIQPEELNDPDYVNRIGNAIAGLNPKDIDRIDVLKDASATALYGVKAANGVIVITTKKGQIGRPIVSYDFSATYRRRPRYTDRHIHLMNSQERVNFSKELIEKHHIYSTDVNLLGYEGLVDKLYKKEMGYDEFSRQVHELEKMNTDWFALLTKDVFSHQHTVSISGGNEDIRYYSSIGYAIDNDVIPGNKFERYTAALNLDASLMKNLTLSFNLNANVGNRRYNSDAVNPIDYAYTTSRAIPAFDKEGKYLYYKKLYSYQQSYNFNILNELENGYSLQDNAGIMLTTNLRYRLANWLNIQGIFSYSTSNTEQERLNGEQTWYAACLRKSDYGVLAPKGQEGGSEMPFGGELSKDYTRANSYTARLQLDVSKYFGHDDRHNIAANIGYEVSSGKYNGYSRLERGYYPDRGKQFTSVELDDYPDYKKWLQGNLARISDNLTNMLSAYFSVSYSYRNYFTLNANTRIDGSNKFGSRSNEKLLPVWSVSGSYNISEHAHMDNRWISNLALRLSYGHQGNMLSGQSPEMIIKKLPFNSHYGELESNVSIYPNPNLRWERTSSFNSGLDFALFNNAIQVNVSYFLKHTEDAFMNKRIASVNGQKEYVINSGTINNSGWSIDATISPVSTEAFRWTLSASYSKIYNSMETLPGADQYELADFLDGNALTKGHAISTFWSYRYIGLNPNNGGPVFDDMRDRKHQLVGKSKYDTYTMVLVPSGQRDPKAQGSITNTFRYKSFRLGMTLNYSLGSKIRLFSLYSDGLNFDPERNVNYELVNRWQHTGDECCTDIPNIINGSDPESLAYLEHWSLREQENGIQILAQNAWDMYDNSDLRVVSGNYLKCSNLSLSYDIPMEKLEKTGISRLTATLSTTNLFDISSKKLKSQTPLQSGFADTKLSERPTWSLSLSVSF